MHKKWFSHYQWLMLQLPKMIDDHFINTQSPFLARTTILTPIHIYKRECCRQLHRIHLFPLLDCIYHRLVVSVKDGLCHCKCSCIVLYSVHCWLVLIVVFVCYLTLFPDGSFVGCVIILFPDLLIEYVQVVILPLKRRISRISASRRQLPVIWRWIFNRSSIIDIQHFGILTVILIIHLDLRQPSHNTTKMLTSKRRTYPCCGERNDHGKDANSLWGHDT